MTTAHQTLILAFNMKFLSVSLIGTCAGCYANWGLLAVISKWGSFENNPKMTHNPLLCQTQRQNLSF